MQAKKKNELLVCGANYRGTEKRTTGSPGGRERVQCWNRIKCAKFLSIRQGEKKKGNSTR